MIFKPCLYIVPRIGILDPLVWFLGSFCPTIILVVKNESGSNEPLFCGGVDYVTH